MAENNFNYKDELAQETLEKIGRLIKTQIPEGYSFSFILADNGETGGIFYMSSMTRESFLESIKELLPKLEWDNQI